MVTVDSDWDEVFRLVSLALDKLKREDSLLFTNRAHERSITHWLAAYLKELFPDWKVDCEYNRIEDDPNEYKYLFLETGESGHVSVFDTDGSRVYPDIVIHHRGRNGREDNLLVIEVKLGWSTQDSTRDLRKLRAFTGQVPVRQIVTYQFGLFVKFAADGSVAESQHFVRTLKT